MALIILGKSTCKLCNEVLQKHQELVAFPAFIADRQDPLYPYSDAAMHRSCFDAWTRRGEMVAKYQAACVRVSNDQVAITNVAIIGALEERAQLMEQLGSSPSPHSCTAPSRRLECGVWTLRRNSKL